MKEVVIVSAARTAIGSFGGSLAGVSAVDLGITAAKGAIERAGIDASLIDEAVRKCFRRRTWPEYRSSGNTRSGIAKYNTRIFNK